MEARLLQNMRWNGVVGLRVWLEYLIRVSYGGVLVGARALCRNLCLLRWGTTLN